VVPSDPAAWPVVRRVDGSADAAAKTAWRLHNNPLQNPESARESHPGLMDSGRRGQSTGRSPGSAWRWLPDSSAATIHQHLAGLGDQVLAVRSACRNDGAVSRYEVWLSPTGSVQRAVETAHRVRLKLQFARHAVGIVQPGSCTNTKTWTMRSCRSHRHVGRWPSNPASFDEVCAASGHQQRFGYALFVPNLRLRTLNASDSAACGHEHHGGGSAGGMTVPSAFSTLRRRP